MSLHEIVVPESKQEEPHQVPKEKVSHSNSEHNKEEHTRTLGIPLAINNKRKSDC